MSLAAECKIATESLRSRLRDIETLVNQSLRVMEQVEEGLPEGMMEDLPSHATDIITAALGVIEQVNYIEGLYKGTWHEKRRWEEQQKANA